MPSNTWWGKVWNLDLQGPAAQIGTVLPSIADQLLTWWRGHEADAHTGFGRDPNDDGSSTKMYVQHWVPIPGGFYVYWGSGEWWYVSTAWEIELGVLIHAGQDVVQNIPPSQIFDASKMQNLAIATGDLSLFTALNLVISDYVKGWVERNDRVATAGFSQQDGGHWKFHVHLDADGTSRWPNAFDMQVIRPFVGTVPRLPASLDILTERYAATFHDIGGRPCSVPFSAANATSAKTIANAIALKSNAKWTELRRIRQLAVPVQDINSDPLFATFGAAAGSGSDVQRKGFCVYDAAAAEDTIKVEIPSVTADLVAKDQDGIAVDPLDGTTRGYLLTENGAPATAFRGAKFGRRIRIKAGV